MKKNIHLNLYFITSNMVYSSTLKSIGEVFCNFLGGVSFSKGGPCWSAGMEAQKRNFGEVKSHA